MFLVQREMLQQEVLTKVLNIIPGGWHWKPTAFSRTFLYGKQRCPHKEVNEDLKAQRAIPAAQRAVESSAVFDSPLQAQDHDGELE